MLASTEEALVVVISRFTIDKYWGEQWQHIRQAEKSKYQPPASCCEYIRRDNGKTIRNGKIDNCNPLNFYMSIETK